ncbi:MAG: hypothetical protein AB1792_00325 [Candidatus Zixiibacteriota bacterium]
MKKSWKSRGTVGAALLVSFVTVGWPEAWAFNPSADSGAYHRPMQVRSATAPVESRRIHHAGRVWASLGNDGTLGSRHETLLGDPWDMQTLQITYAPSFEFPSGSRLDYLYMGSIWIGAIVANDTLVSLSHGGWASQELLGFQRMQDGIPNGYPWDCKPRDTVTRGLQEVHNCVYYDTMVLAGGSTDPERSGPHLPIGLEITQVSHAGSDPYTQGFIIVDQRIKNISDHAIEKVWLGIHADNDIWYQLGSWQSLDDVSGFLHLWPNPAAPTYMDTLNVAWAADNDADPVGGEYVRSSCRGAMGFRILRAPAGTHVNFNWWTVDGNAVFDWGPRNVRDLRGLGHGGTGSPESDRAMYHFMSNDEIDYGQLFTPVDYTAEGWRPPPARPFSCNLGDGWDTYLCLSVGPIPRLEPGEEIPFTYALILGDSLHQDPTNRYDCGNPQAYYNKLSFTDLARNAWWAAFVFDNFGVDTDNDGYSGESFVDSVSGERVYTSGDGCPDLSGPSSPPCPHLELISRPKELTIRWSGQVTELATDPQLLEQDFEGYKVYYAERNSRDDIPAPEDYTLLASWDKMDFRRYTWDPAGEAWRPTSSPKTASEWRGEFQDAGFDPEAHARPSFESCYRYADRDPEGAVVERCAYFVPAGFNMGNEYVVAGDTVRNLIRRVATRTDESGREYGEYEVTLDNLLQAKHYFVSITAFDYGDPVKSLPSLEITPGQCRVDGLPIYSADVVEAYWDSGGARHDSVRVMVYPNPYKISFLDADGHRTSYYEQGYEGTVGQRSSGQPLDERDRRIHFINVPHDARIRIYTLDGDLVRTLDHPDENLSGYSSKISWDVVSRNTQAVTSGIYIYRVDSKLGSQVGKIVIIK